MRTSSITFATLGAMAIACSSPKKPEEQKTLGSAAQLRALLERKGCGLIQKLPPSFGDAAFQCRVVIARAPCCVMKVQVEATTTPTSPMEPQLTSFGVQLWGCEDSRALDEMVSLATPLFSGDQLDTFKRFVQTPSLSRDAQQTGHTTLMLTRTIGDAHVTVTLEPGADFPRRDFGIDTYYPVGISMLHGEPMPRSDLLDGQLCPKDSAGSGG